MHRCVPAPSGHAGSADLARDGVPSRSLEEGHMHKFVARALLLAVTILLVGVVPTLAQTDDGLIDRPNGSVLVGVQNDVSLASGETADAVFVWKGDAVIGGAAKAVVAIDSDVTVSGPGASVD